MAKKKKTSNKNFVYVITNKDSFTILKCVKIGFSGTPEKRFQTLLTAVPEPFKVHAIAIVKGRDKSIEVENKVHDRIVKTEAGRKIRGDYFFVDPKKACDLLEKVTLEVDPNHGQVIPFKPPISIENFDIQKVIKYSKSTKITKKYTKFQDKKGRIDLSSIIGKFITYKDDSNIKLEVVSRNKVLYEGKARTLTFVAKKLSGKKNCDGPSFFLYNNKPLVNR